MEESKSKSEVIIIDQEVYSWEEGGLSFKFPYLKRVYPNSIINSFINVQPMVSPHQGEVFYLDLEKKEEKTPKNKITKWKNK